MNATMHCPPRRVSRAKLGLSLLACVAIVLAAGQMAASPAGARHPPIEGVSP